MGSGGAFADQKRIKKGHKLKDITVTNQGTWRGQTWLPGNKSFYEAAMTFTVNTSLLEKALLSLPVL